MLPLHHALCVVGRDGFEPPNQPDMPAVRRGRFTVSLLCPLAYRPMYVNIINRATGLSPVGAMAGFGCAYLTSGLFPCRPRRLICYIAFSYLSLLRNFLFGRSQQDLNLFPPAYNHRRAVHLHQTSNSCHTITALYGRLCNSLYEWHV